MHAPRPSVISRQSKSFSANRRRRNVWTLILFFIVISTFTFSLSRVSNLDILSIHSVNVIGVDNVIGGEIISLAMNEMGGSYMGLLSKGNIFLYPKQTIKSLIYNKYPKYENVVIERSRDSLNVTLNEKKPTAIICPNLPDFDGDNLVINDSNCYFADDDGLIFDAFNKDVNNKQVSNLARYFTPDATSTPKFRELQVIYNEIDMANIKMQGLLVKPNGEYELYALGSNNKTIVIYLNDLGKIKNEVENLIAFWSKKESIAKSKRELLDFDYIDARYVPNVFYRLNQ